MLPSSAADSEPHRHFPVDRGTRSEPRSDEDATTGPWHPRPFAVSRHPWIPVTAPIQVAGGEDPPVGIFTARASHLIVLPCCTGRGASVARRTVPLGAGLADARLRSGGVSGPPGDALRREARTPAGGAASGCGPRQVDSGSRQGIRAHQKVRQAAEGVAARLGAQRPRNVSRDMPQSGPVQHPWMAMQHGFLASHTFPRVLGSHEIGMGHCNPAYHLQHSHRAGRAPERAQRGGSPWACSRPAPPGQREGRTAA